MKHEDKVIIHAWAITRGVLLGIEAGVALREQSGECCGDELFTAVAGIIAEVFLECYKDLPNEQQGIFNQAREYALSRANGARAEWRN